MISWLAAAVQRGPARSAWMAVQLRRVECRGCSQVFFVCQRCDFGRWYCSEPCRHRARERSRRRARRKYASTDEGRLNNRNRQRRFRQRHRTAWNTTEKPNSVTDQSSQVGLPGVRCSQDENLGAAPSPGKRPPVASSTQPATARRTLSRPRWAPLEPQATKKAAKLAAKAASRASGRPLRLAPCRFCGRWGVVVETSSARGRFRRSPHGRYMNPRRIE